MRGIKPVASLRFAFIVQIACVTDGRCVLTNWYKHTLFLIFVQALLVAKYPEQVSRSYGGTRREP